MQVSSRVIPQPPALEIEFTAHEQSSGRLDSLRGELRQEGVGEVPLNHLIPLLLEQAEACLHGEIRVDIFQRLGGVEAEVVLGPGKCLCDCVQHSGRADPGQRLGAFLVEEIAPILKELVDEKG